jgi:hypothetical protein
LNPVSLREYQEIRSGILESASSSSGTANNGNGGVGSSMIGDWQIKECEPEQIRLVVNPGYGASKKMSFIHPDVSAVLCYTFVLRPTSSPQLFINGLRVAADHIR